MEEIWQEFVALLKRDPFPAEKVKPYQPTIKAFLLEWLDARRDKANWEEWAAPSEVHRVGQQVHFLLPDEGQITGHGYLYASYLL